MNNPKNKTKLLTAAILSLFIFSIAIPMMTVDAHTPAWYLTSYAYVTASPNPVGQGQTVYLMMWLAMPIPSAAGTTGDRWHPYLLNITKPDGNIAKLGPYVGSGPGLTGAQFTDTQEVGTYNVTFYFPGQQVLLAGYTGLNSTAGATFLSYVNDTWGPAYAYASFVVQAEPLQWMPTVDPPTSYWTRPIDQNNFLTWQSIGGSWLGSNLQGANYWKFQPYGYGPQTAHVMWTDPLTWGGVVEGGNAINHYAGGYKSPYAGNQMTFYSGTQYQLRGSSPIIMYQNLYVQLPADASQANTGGGYTCISLITGKTLWTRPDLTGSPMFGQFYDFDSVNQHGTTGVYLWFSTTVTGTRLQNPTATQLGYLSGTYAPGKFSNLQLGSVNTGAYSASGWLAIDPMTGKNDFNETNIAGAAFGTITAYGPQGEWLRYGLAGVGAGTTNSTKSYVSLWQWNNTQLPGNEVIGGITGWTTYGNSYNMSASYDFNVSLTDASGAHPLGNGPANDYAQQGHTTYGPSIVHVWPGDLAFGQSSNLQLLGTTEAYFGTPDQYELWAINLNASRGPVGKVLWDRLYDSQGGNSTFLIGPQDDSSRVFTMYVRETQTFYGFNIDTGDPLWGPTQSQDAFNYFTGVTALTWPSAVGYQTLYNSGHSGIIYAFDLKTGKTVFIYGSNASDPFNSTRTIETAYGGYPTQIAAVSDNTVYAFAEEHSIDAPAYRGGSIRAIDATTGQEKWKLYGMAPYQSAAVADGYLVYYNLMDGREYAIGPGPSATTVNAPGAGITIGNPVEITGTVTDQSPNNALHDTAAIADKDQGPWMEYMVEQTIVKPDVQGVLVTLTIMDSNNQVAATVQVTSDSSGIYHYAWTPTTAGEYTVYASFGGSLSYGPSSAETATVVGTAPSTQPIVTPTPSTGTPTPGPTSAPVSVSPSSPNGPGGISATELYLIGVSIVVVIVVVAAAVILRRRSKPA